jgi:hypothetical protein
LLKKHITAAEVNIMRRNFYVGPTVYTIALLVALVSGVASVVLILALAVFYAVGTRSPQ